MPFGFAFYGMNTNPFRKVFCACFIFLSVAAIAVTYSRAGFITLVVVLCLCLWRMLKKGSGLKVGIYIFLILTAFVLLSPLDYLVRLQAITDFSKDSRGQGRRGRSPHTRPWK